MGFEENTRNVKPTQDFVSEHAKMKEFLLARKAANDRNAKFLICPADSKFMARWDMLTTFALVYTCLVTPVEVAYGLDSDELFWINRAFDVVFIVDMVLQFFIMPVAPPKLMGHNPLNSIKLDDDSTRSKLSRTVTKAISRSTPTPIRKLGSAASSFAHRPTCGCMSLQSASCTLPTTKWW